MATQHQVVDHRQVREQRQVLKRSSHPEFGGVRRLEVEQLDPVELGRTGLWAIDGVEAIEDRGLAGTVRADHRKQLTRVNVVAHVSQRCHPTEFQRDVSDFEQRWRCQRILHHEPQCFWRR